MSITTLIAIAVIAILASIVIGVSAIKSDVRGKYLLFGVCCCIVVLGCIFIDVGLDFVADQADTIINQIIN